MPSESERALEAVYRLRDYIEHHSQETTAFEDPGETANVMSKPSPLSLDVRATDTPDLVLLDPISYAAPMNPGSFPGFIKFQSGPVLEAGINGTSMEVVLSVVAQRLRGYQRGPFPCVENEHALASINAALSWLELRTTRRREQGVEGRNLAHTSGGPR